MAQQSVELHPISEPDIPLPTSPPRIYSSDEENYVEGNNRKDAMEAFKFGRLSFELEEYTEAVKYLEDCCATLSRRYGDKCVELVEPYYYYGRTLLEIARMESDVLGNALKGIDEEKLHTGVEEEADTSVQLSEEEKEKMSEMVLDAMTEDKTSEEASAEAAEEKLKDSPLKAQGTADESSEVGTGGGEPAEGSELCVKEKIVESDETLGERKTAEESSESIEAEKDEKKIDCEGMEVENTEETSVQHKTGQEKIEDGSTNLKDTEMTEDSNKEQAEGSEKVDVRQKQVVESHGTEEAKESVARSNDGVTKSENGVEEKQDEQQAMETSDDSKEQANPEAEDCARSQSSEDAASEDVSNLQLAWEVLDTARLILTENFVSPKPGSSDDIPRLMKLLLANVHMALAEVAMENSKFNQAVTDIQAALEIRQKYLNPNSRLTAEAHFQCGVAFANAKDYDKAIADTIEAAKILTTCVANEDTSTLRRVLEEVTAKIEELKEEKKSAAAAVCVDLDDKENVTTEHLSPQPIAVRKKNSENIETSPLRSRKHSKEEEKQKTEERSEDKAESEK